MLKVFTNRLFLPTLIPLSTVGTTCFSSCCDKDSAFIFTTGRLPDVNPLYKYHSIYKYPMTFLFN
jgi:hypothetical protein